jgi:ribosome biogenesis SPOUT family RNA methylase Rps3
MPAEPTLTSYVAKGPPSLHPIIPKAFIVEHLDPELAGWSSLEYQCIAVECAITPPHGSAYFVLSGVPTKSDLPKELLAVKGMKLEHRTIEELCSETESTSGSSLGWKKERVCLMDPKAERELSPEDGELFDAFLFGGILGELQPRP